MTRGETAQERSSSRKKQIGCPARIIRSSLELWPRLMPKPDNLRTQSRLRDAHRSRRMLRVCVTSPFRSRRMSIFIGVAPRCGIPTCEMSDKISERSLVAGICAGLVALVWFVFGQAIKFPFINFDDPEYVYEVPEINAGLTLHGIAWAFTHLPSPNWYPLTNISHMMEFQIYGLNAGGYHLTNVLLHALTAVLLFILLRR